jgi:cellulose synthase (UDP-forming)
LKKNHTKNAFPFTRKRQWGTEKRTAPLSTVHEKPSTKKITLSRLAIVLTVGLWILYIIATIIRQFFDGPHSYRFTLEAFSYLTVVTFLTFSALMYLLARQGALQRFSKHVRVPRAELDRHFAKNQPSITVLVPSYSEETQVVRMTLMSAALQEYPDMRIVLLIDDNPNPSDPSVEAKLNATRQLGEDIMDVFSEPRKQFSEALAKFEKSIARKSRVNAEGVQELAGHYAWAADWLNGFADKEEISDHVDIFFTEQVLRGLAKELRLVGDALTASYLEGAELPASRVKQLYRRLAWVFSFEIEAFERKKFISLSHEANKAMNLNSYIGLMGGKYKRTQTPDGTVLMPVSTKKSADLTIPDSDFLLTLDADSILLQDYCLRLVYFLQQPNNAHVAVTQTPYSSFRGAATRIERLAGATTDIQHILHQGMSHYGATFWVGANAVIRKKSLDDIAESEWVGGFEIRRYIQDRTVIEDTESSIDLTQHGWSLVNYPERLSYSATPPDFGSLIVQRRRWANGGLLILPKFWNQIRDRKRNNRPVSQAEIMLRVNYMASIAWASFGLMFLLAYPYDGRLLSPFVILAALPYFISMASDLKYCGYKRSDIFRIYGFNLILLPVNLAGVLKSIQQALSGKKIPFARTPKVKNRTVSPMLYVIAPLFIVGFSVFTVWRNVELLNWGNAAFAAFNTFSASWAIISYIGIKNTLADIWIGLTDRLYHVTTPNNGKQVKQGVPELDWRAVLYHGDTEGTLPLLVRSQEAAANGVIDDNTANTHYQPTPAITWQRRLSPLRLVLASVFIGSLVALGNSVGVQQWQEARSASSDEAWFAAYVDVTATPTFSFEQMGATSSRDAVLSFIVSASSDPCTPSWGNAFSMDQAGTSLDLDRRIARLQQQGGSVAISFGGLFNDELAVNCTDHDRLVDAYRSVIERYDIDTIDLDLEGEGLTSQEAAIRRAAAIAEIQQDRRNQDDNLAVWVTLPVAPQGLTEDGTNAVSALLEGDVDLAGVNIMTMNYGSSKDEDDTMQQASEKAILETVRQLDVLYKLNDIYLTDATLWSKIGVTPMIGQNDVEDEVLTLEDAEGLNEFAITNGAGRMSMWSANRDIECGSNYADVKIVSDSCSGVAQDREDFAVTLSAGFEGSLTLSADYETVTNPDANNLEPDDPETSPYQIWSESGAYLAGTKVVWRHYVYEAKWWTRADIPDNPVLQSWQTPWKLVGPVLPGETPIKQATLPPNTYPKWSGEETYDTGQRVLFEGMPYEAKWWNQGYSPAAASSNADNSPWAPLTQAEINKILESSQE